jgi:CRP/FNR family nitrogen fixation transcriptional regulator
MITIPKNSGTKAVALFGRHHDLLGVVSIYQPDQEIYGEGEPAKALFEVLRGVVRKYKLLEDGRRQIAAFHFKGDVFGLELDERYSTTADAVGTAHVASFRRDKVVAAASQSLELARDLWARAALNLDHAQCHILLLGRKTAMEKVEGFLADMNQRTGRAGRINLPMTRLDIADFLGLTLETVSRCLSRMQDDGRLCLSGARKVALRQSTMVC